jgi:hypothetical protein
LPERDGPEREITRHHSPGDVIARIARRQAARARPEAINAGLPDTHQLAKGWPEHYFWNPLPIKTLLQRGGLRMGALSAGPCLSGAWVSGSPSLARSTKACFVAATTLARPNAFPSSSAPICRPNSPESNVVAIDISHLKRMRKDIICQVEPSEHAGEAPVAIRPVAASRTRRNECPDRDQRGDPLQQRANGSKQQCGVVRYMNRCSS